MSSDFDVKTACVFVFFNDNLFIYCVNSIIMMLKWESTYTIQNIKITSMGLHEHVITDENISLTIMIESDKIMSLPRIALVKAPMFCVFKCLKF